LKSDLSFRRTHQLNAMLVEAREQVDYEPEGGQAKIPKELLHGFSTSIAWPHRILWSKRGLPAGVLVDLHTSRILLDEIAWYRALRFA
jgi:hypothetical protein